VFGAEFFLLRFREFRAVQQWSVLIQRRW
jgi:hypothetical protein